MFALDGAEGVHELLCAELRNVASLNALRDVMIQSHTRMYDSVGSNINNEQPFACMDNDAYM